jgi:hypothetical protein
LVAQPVNKDAPAMNDSKAILIFPLLFFDWREGPGP